ncbi:MAG: nuclear transport factor 2 family protein [Solirubrobacterales bacterium]
MLQTNVEIVRSVYVALNLGDWDGVFRDTHPEMTLTTQRGLNAGTKLGREDVQGFLEDYRRAFDKVVWDPEELHETAERVVVVVTTRGRPQGSDAEIVNRNGHIWTIRHGKILSLQTFPDSDKALEAAGLAGRSDDGDRAG